MLKHCCNDCQREFVAIAFEEAKKEAESEGTPFEETEEDREQNTLGYAKFCPYCGGLDIEVCK